MPNSAVPITSAARATGVSPSTLRLWEGYGLVRPARTRSGHRRYRPEDLARIRDVRRLRAVQRLNIAAITTMLQARAAVSGNGRDGARVLGERLHALRLSRALSLREVSRRSGLAVSFISSIERGLGGASVASLKKLARCYGRTLAALTAPKRLRDQTVIRAGRYRALPMLGPGITVEQLAEGQRAMDCQRWILEPGAASQGPYQHEGEEFIHVLSGQFHITLDGRHRYRLRQGDSMYFKSTSLHAWVNPGPGRAALLWINTPPTF